MKWLTVRKYIITMAILLSSGKCFSQQFDPILNGTVTSGNLSIVDQLKKTNNNQNSIIASNSAIMLTMEQIRSYEDKMYKYLSETQSIIRNAYDVVRCADLVTSIYDNLSKCTDAVKDHPQGAVISIIVSRQYSKIYGEVTSLYGYVAGLAIKSGEQNLLTTAERNKILTTVVTRLSFINRNLRTLRYQIMVYRWTDVVKEIAPKEYYMLVDCDLITKRIKRDIDRMSK